MEINIQKDTETIEWDALVDSADRNGIFQKEKINSNSTGKFKEKIWGVTAVREEQELTREATSKKGLEVYHRLDAGIGLKTCLSGTVRHRHEAAI